MTSQSPERSYYLVETCAFESLLRKHFMLIQTTQLFEYLLSQSERPMFLSAAKVCEALGFDRHRLEQYRRKRIIKARAVNGRMMYSAYDVISLAEHLQRRKIQRILSAAVRFVIR